MKILTKVSEMFTWSLDASRSIITAPWSALNAIRSGVRVFGMRFWPQGHPASDQPVVNYTITRHLYRNCGDVSLGAGFCKPIVDLQVGFIGIPSASTDNETTDDFLNNCLQVHWTEEIQQMIRDSLRDSKTIVRINKPDIFDPLMTIDEAEHCTLEILAPERVNIERNMRNKRVIDRAMIEHEMVILTDPGAISEGRDPTYEQHTVIEIIDRTSFSFFDRTDMKFLDSMASVNKWGFVPLLEVHNEWDSALQDGQSEFESVMPFIRAFNDLMIEGLRAHKYHSTPKVKFQLRDVTQFIKNNFPNVLDDNGQVVPGAEVEWKGREILFFQPEEDGEFLEARSVLGDTKTLAEFVIDCICIASETPEWAFMRVDSGSANSDRNAQTVPFIKKIDRKRRMYTRPIQELLKMVQVIQDGIPVIPKLSWEIVREDDRFIHMQALQQLIMGLEVAAQSGEISDETYRKMLRTVIPMMKNSAQEAKDAKTNTALVLAQTAANGNAATNAPQPEVTTGSRG